MKSPFPLGTLLALTLIPLAAQEAPSNAITFTEIDSRTGLAKRTAHLSSPTASRTLETSRRRSHL